MTSISEMDAPCIKLLLVACFACRELAEDSIFENPAAMSRWGDCARELQS